MVGATHRDGYVDQTALNDLLHVDDEHDADDDHDQAAHASELGLTDEARSRVSGVLRRRPLDPDHQHDNNNGAAPQSKVRASVKETGNDSMRRYLKTMSGHELLRAEDEVVLGRQIRILVRWEEKKAELEEELLRTPTFAEWATFVNTTAPELKKQIRRSKRAKAAFVEANLRLVVSLARQAMKNKGNRSEIEFRDACQDGIVGLMKACEKFDPERGFRFSTYANWWIKRAIMESVVDQPRLVKVPYDLVMRINKMNIASVTLTRELGRKPTDSELANRLEITTEQLDFYRQKSQTAVHLDKKLSKTNKRKGSGASTGGADDAGETKFGDILEDPDQDSVADASTRMLRDDVRRLVTTLKPKEQAVIRLRFGMDGDDPTPKSLSYISRRFNVPVEKIRRVEARALRKLKHPYRSNTIKCYVSDL